MTSSLRKFCLTVLGVTALTAGAPQGASAIALLDGFGGPEGYGQLAMGRNDDGSSNQLNLPFNINFFGNTFSSLFINNNGNVTFNARRSTFTPFGFPFPNNTMIAPYFADVDTRCSTCGAVYVAEGQTNNPNDTVVVTWHDVGYFSNHGAPNTNDFQLVLRDRSDTGAGNFDIDFRYNRLLWTTGDASGGSGGLGGTEAVAGFDAGNGTDFVQLPGSLTPSVLNLQNTSNVSTSTPGLWTFAVRNGSPPGSEPSNPLLPVIEDDGFNFDFNVDLNQTVFVDPPVAIGYDYVVDSGPNFASVLIPIGTVPGDGVFELLVGGSSFVLNEGDVFDFLALDSLGFNSFSIRGIDPSAALDPNDGTAFVTGLSFVSAGAVSMRQIPVTIDVNGTSVPAPGTAILLAVGLLAVRLRSRLAH